MANNKGKRKSPQRKKNANKRASINTPSKLDMIRAERFEMEKRLRELKHQERVERSQNKARKIGEKQRRAVASEVGQLKSLIDFGLYNPKKKRRFTKSKKITLTRAEKAAIKKYYRKWAPFLQGKHVPVKIPQRSKKTVAAIRKKAGQAGFQATDKVIFYPRGTSVTKARIIKNKDTGYEIVAEREFHASKKGRSGETVHIPLASADELDVKRAQLNRRYKMLAGKAGPNGRIRFYVEGKYGSHRVFTGDDFDDLWAELNQYRNTQGEMYDFISTIKLGIVKFNKHGVETTKRNKVKTSRDKELENAMSKKGFTTKRIVKVRKVNATGRSK